MARGVAPLNASTTFSPAPLIAVQTVSPDIFPGYAKNRKALAVNAGFKIFLPVPPNISFPITTPKEIPRATCQRGIVGGSIRGNKRPVTRSPSLILCFLTTANRVSQKNPTTYETKIIGRTMKSPLLNTALRLRGSPDAKLDWYPAL